VFALIRAITRLAPTKKQYNYSLKVRPKGANLIIYYVEIFYNSVR